MKNERIHNLLIIVSLIVASVIVYAGILWEMITSDNVVVLILQVTSVLSFSILIKMFSFWIREFKCSCFYIDKNVFNIVKKFQVNKLWIFLGIFSVLFMVYYKAAFDVFLCVGIFVVGIYLFLQQPNKIEFSTILENNDINIGCGAAQAYFHGYLKVLMSQKEQSWQERLKEYEQKQGVKIFSKLIILLPKSCKTFDTLTNVKCTPNIHWACKLRTLKIDVCGNQRKYKNTVYVINEGIRFVAEYAPPINTFHQMSYIGVKYNLNADTRREQYILFQKTLQHLINNDMDCVNNCLLLSYNDEEDLSLSELILLSIKDDELQTARAAG
ncbi:stimulator of interferon genes protein 3-like isoform X1 [Centruroides vittatus]|uniref:stimulator of interferon genes protein 3-like isoform X1 n=2 Tax=Centruroides vittatus TaxID=120091 RepID=UPI00350FCD07